MLAIVACVAVIKETGLGRPAFSSPAFDVSEINVAVRALAGTGKLREPRGRLPKGTTAERLTRAAAPLPQQRQLQTHANIRLSTARFPADRERRRGRFVRVPGGAGFARLPLPPMYQTMQNAPNLLNTPLAAGDVNRDGWPDVATGGFYGVYLYVNIGGRLAMQQIGFARMRHWNVTYVAIENLDGDAQPDLFFCTWMHGCWILWNRSGEFSSKAVTRLRRGPENGTISAAFADFSHSGRLDIATGGTTGLPEGSAPSNSPVTVWRNRGGRHFTREVLRAPTGETLSLLATDFNDDGWADLYAAHDYDEPDIVFLNRRGRLLAANASSSPFPASTRHTMSVSAADVRNDGRPMIYESNVAYGAPFTPGYEHPGALPANCAASYPNDGTELRSCLRMADFQATVFRAVAGAPQRCSHMSGALRRRDCMADFLWDRTLPAREQPGTPPGTGACRRIPPSLTYMHDVCLQGFKNPLDFGQSEKVLTDQMPQVRDTNLLFAPGEARYTNVTRAFRVGFGSWSWDANFTDIDNDGWQDLFITQGFPPRPTDQSNILYKNERGVRFKRATARLGLDYHVPNGGSLSLDLNLDGRPDLITYPLGLTPVVWRNGLRIKPGVQITLRDHRHENSDAVGARVTIESIDGQTQMREINAGGGFVSADLAATAFGLGAWSSVAAITVRWPDGQTSRIDGLALGAGRYTIDRLQP